MEDILITGEALSGTEPTTGAKNAVDQRNRDREEARRLKDSVRLAEEIASHSGRRKDIPIRHLFVRDPAREGATPLTRLVNVRGRGNAVALRLYIALIWKCSAPPFDTEISARKWAELLALEDPGRRGARRITDALQTLSKEKLIQVEHRHGEASIITLLEESGTGRPYDLPSTSYVRSRGKEQERHRYFKVPAKLWTGQHIQQLSAPAIAMLLVTLSSAQPGQPVWWSTTLFPEMFGLSSATRARGTKELVDRGLLDVSKTLVGESSVSKREFGRERVRNNYQLFGDANPFPRKRKPPALGTFTPKKKEPAKP